MEAHREAAFPEPEIMPLLDAGPANTFILDLSYLQYDKKEMCFVHNQSCFGSCEKSKLQGLGQKRTETNAWIPICEAEEMARLVK